MRFVCGAWLIVKADARLIISTIQSKQNGNDIYRNINSYGIIAAVGIAGIDAVRARLASVVVDGEPAAVTAHQAPQPGCPSRHALV
jgi:hypothetical protein